MSTTYRRVHANVTLANGATHSIYAGAVNDTDDVKNFKRRARRVAVEEAAHRAGTTAAGATVTWDLESTPASTGDTADQPATPATELKVGQRVRRTAQAYQGAPHGTVVRTDDRAAYVRMDDDGEIWLGTELAWTLVDSDAVAYVVEYGDESGAQARHTYTAAQREDAVAMFLAITGTDGVNYAGFPDDSHLDEHDDDRVARGGGYDPRDPATGHGRGNWSAWFIALGAARPVEQTNLAETLARVTGSVGATYTEDRREADGSLTVTSHTTYGVTEPTDPAAPAARKGKGRTFTVTHPDGTVSTRTSAKANYTHAVVVTTPLEGEVARRVEHLNIATAALASVERDLEQGERRDDASPWPVRGEGAQWVRVYLGSTYAGAYITPLDARLTDEQVRADALATADRARTLVRDREDALELAKAGPANTFEVLRWSSRADLAAKATSEFEGYAARRMATLAVVPVD